MTLEEIHGQILHLRGETHALSVLLQEAMAIVLSHEAKPDKSASLVRQDLEQIQKGAETLAQKQPGGVHPIQAAHFARVRAELKRSMDAIEKRVSTLMRDRTTH